MNLLKKACWAIKRPYLYSHVLRQLVGKIAGKPNDTHAKRAEAEQWCKQLAQETPSALRLLLAKDTFVDIHDAYGETLRHASHRESACPVRMGGPGNLNLLYHCAESLGATRVIETGVAYGWSSLALLLSLAHRDGAKLVSVDMPYPMLDNDTYVGFVVPETLRSRWNLIRRPDRVGIPSGLKELGQIDLCHYDSDKSYDGRMWAYPILWAALRPGGIFISDDISDNLAFRDFCVSRGLSPTIISFDSKYAGVLRKG
jgi:predicted O-methyltransferase YrrM